MQAACGARVTVVQSLAFRGPRRRSSDTIHIGLVNNMPDAALRATELQFARLLKDASGPVDVRLHFFSFPEIERSELAQSRMEGQYVDAATLPQTPVDALIVTGAEPRAADMRDEPYWNSFARLTDWAEHGTISTLFSCLAAHAAVLHLDGVTRRALPQKLSGVFACETVQDDPLVFNAPQTFVPHSRFNELVEEDLSARNYQVLSRIAGGGVNLFTRQSQSLFVFSQGHPEYDETTLGREYLRDVGRYLNGERAERPAMPQNYFDPATEAALSEMGLGVRSAALLERYAGIVAHAVPRQSWRDGAVTLFGNWLILVAAEKARRRIRAAAGIPLHKLRRSA